MEISLYPHNKETYQTAFSMMEKHRKAMIIHPIDSGKSFVDGYPGKKIFVLAPRQDIYDSQVERLQMVFPETDICGICSRTYPGSIVIDQAELETLQPDCIVFDEFHRADADQWGECVRRLLDCYLGTPTWA